MSSEDKIFEYFRGRISELRRQNLLIFQTWWNDSMKKELHVKLKLCIKIKVRAHDLVKGRTLVTEYWQLYQTYGINSDDFDPTLSARACQIFFCSRNEDVFMTHYESRNSKNGPLIMFSISTTIEPIDYKEWCKISYAKEWHAALKNELQSLNRNSFGTSKSFFTRFGAKLRDWMDNGDIVVDNFQSNVGLRGVPRAMGEAERIRYLGVWTSTGMDPVGRISSLEVLDYLWESQHRAEHLALAF